jgi:hypothetical protein
VVDDLYAGRASKDDLLAAVSAKGFDVSGMDTFGSILYEEAAKNPGIKAILTTRDPDKWAESLSLTVGLHYGWFQMRPFRWIPVFRKLGPFFQHQITLLTNGRPDEPTNRAAMKEAKADHERRVRSAFPPSQLLVWSATEGWPPLCEFLELGDRCPSTPFPNANNRATMVGITWALFAMTWIWPLVFLAPLALLAGAVRCCCGSRTPTKKKAA